MFRIDSCERHRVAGSPWKDGQRLPDWADLFVANFLAKWAIEHVKE